MPKIKTDEGTLVNLMIVVLAFCLLGALTLMKLSGWEQVDESNSIELIDSTNTDGINLKNTLQ